MATLTGEELYYFWHLHAASLHSGSWNDCRSPSFSVQKSHAMLLCAIKQNLLFPPRRLCFRYKWKDLHTFYRAGTIRRTLLCMANRPKGNYLGRTLTSLTVQSIQSPAPLSSASTFFTERACEKHRHTKKFLMNHLVPGDVNSTNDRSQLRTMLRTELHTSIVLQLCPIGT